MSHISDLSSLNLSRRSVVTIGVFDGVHLGHQHLIRQLVETAHAQDKNAVVLTFFPHPDVVIRGLTGRYYLTSAEERARLLLDLGVDYVVTHAFDDSVRHVRAADFVDRLLMHLKVSDLWVGEDFALGYKREGNVEFLTRQGEEKGFSVSIVDMVQANSTGHAISSTLIRELLRAGEVEKVRHFLGRSYSVEGVVVDGQKRGRMIGFPTANMQIWDEQVIPMNGIYACWAYLGSERFMAMTNVGISPTFGNKNVTVEPYLLDFDRDIYGHTLRITFEKFMRPEAKFDGIDALIVQIQRDVDEGRVYLMSRAASQS